MIYLRVTNSKKLSIVKNSNEAKKIQNIFHLLSARFFFATCRLFASSQLRNFIANLGVFLLTLELQLKS